ncbi:nuclear transport factor 2 family protein [Enterococcus sp. AZ196]|uniref:nuclear transport factor 2 family protein n=1 Tax=Enterococcus sp. AZ196 TaxID=2774659 RepID=UPI003D2A41F2
MKMKIALQFVKAINQHDVKGISQLMSNDHQFIDTWDNIASKEEMSSGWAGYFNWFPNYHIEVTEAFENENSIGLLGYASGSYKGNTKQTWRLPAFWKVVIGDEKVKIWQVICDAKIPFDIMNESDKEDVEKLKTNN